jgi:uncharacterized protein (DUF2126 family)
MPGEHFVNWQQDPQGNYLARIVFPQQVRHFHIEVDLVAEMTVINPFDFFLEPEANEYPFRYAAPLAKELKPFLDVDSPGPRLGKYLEAVDRTPRKTVDFLVDLNSQLKHAIQYLIRLEPGVQTCEDTLAKRSGSCRDSAWLMVTLLRHLGIAARFVSGYLIQLKPDITALDGPAGTDHDFTDLHAWAEAYLPGAGWIGLDPTSGLLAGEGHIPLACTPDPYSAAPISGAVDNCKTEFNYHMTVDRVLETPRVTLPYTDEQWQEVNRVGHHVDELLSSADVRLTMGGEPTFVSIDDMESEQWRTAALGPEKFERASDLLYRLKKRFGTGSMLHCGQGKWYPGEPLPRWAFRSYWRVDGIPIWRDERLLARPDKPGPFNVEYARRFARALARQLGVDPCYVVHGYEDVMYYMWKERRLPANVDLRDSKLEDETERRRLARVFEQGVTQPVGCVLPLQYQWWLTTPRWCSGPWVVRAEELFLIPGDSPMGFRLPLQSLIWEPTGEHATNFFPYDPLEKRSELPDFHSRYQPAGIHGDARFNGATITRQQRRRPQAVTVGVGPASGVWNGDDGRDDTIHFPAVGRNNNGASANSSHGSGNGNGRHDSDRDEDAQSPLQLDPALPPSFVRTALCVEPREGRLHVFLPPVDRLEHFLDLIAAIEATARSLNTPVVLEGYLPPHDSRLGHFSVTPDPGVIEVNVPPAACWEEAVSITSWVYEDARQARLGTEKFDLDGSHTGTGGGNHVVLGGPTPADSPFLRRPDLLQSLVAYWHNHPSLSYLFSCRFIGPTSQAPRVDEGRCDAIYELQIAMEQLTTTDSPPPPWLVDRVFRHLLVDITGNTHRAEFCIDKLYSPDSSSGRLGLVELRALEMPPDARMSLAQQLLIRALIARFWRKPYREKLVRWRTAIHDRFLLPYFVWNDFNEVIEETRGAGIELNADWFGPHFEFRFPVIGEFAARGIHVELRQAIEPWYVLGEEPGGGGTTRYVDSSVERLQVLVQGMVDERHGIACCGRRVPLHPTGTVGEFVAGVRYRAWQPPSCLHPTIPVDTPLTFDLFDNWSQRSLGGCQYHVGHPGGLNPERFPVNSYEAESRRAGRFFAFGHTPGSWTAPTEQESAEFPMTLDLRRGRQVNG